MSIPHRLLGFAVAIVLTLAMAVICRFLPGDPARPDADLPSA
ncbi:MAG TPA: hypothetical protein PKM48_00750 [Parvularculaceae bacterium]|nr:hypothetical protein [Parvularculaceae bacterium]